MNAIELSNKTAFLGLLWKAKVQIRFDDMDNAVIFAIDHGGWIGANENESEIIWFSSRHTIGEAFKALPSGNFRIGPFDTYRPCERIIPSVVWH